jgi:hypothetical protein
MTIVISSEVERSLLPLAQRPPINQTVRDSSTTLGMTKDVKRTSLEMWEGPQRPDDVSVARLVGALRPLPH